MNPEQLHHLERLERAERAARLAGNPTPTLEDVDAELQPKGLPVIELDGAAWVGPWIVRARDSRRRMLLLPKVGDFPKLVQADVWKHNETRWDFCFESIGGIYGREHGHPTPEAAQAACEAAIVAAWRNR